MLSPTCDHDMPADSKSDTLFTAGARGYRVVHVDNPRIWRDERVRYRDDFTPEVYRAVRVTRVRLNVR